jgi:hypothetical protein
MYWQVRGTDLLRHLMVGSCEDRRRPPCVLSPRAADLERLARQHASNPVPRKKRYTDEDCSLVLALLDGESTV